MSVVPYPDPPDVPCAGCGDPTPYRAGGRDSDAPSYGEWHHAPLGMCYARTHRRRECVIEARRRNQCEAKNKHAEALGPSDLDKQQQQLGKPSPTEGTT